MTERFCITGNYDIVDVEKELLLVPLNSYVGAKKAIVLNEMAARIFKAIQKNHSRKNIFDDIYSTYKIEEVKLKSDIDKCFNDFLRLNIIELEK